MGIAALVVPGQRRSLVDGPSQPLDDRFGEECRVDAGHMQRAITHIKEQGVDLAGVATGGDPGHAPARALYERLDFNPLRVGPVAFAH